MRLRRPSPAPLLKFRPAADPVSHTFRVKADLPATPGLRSGQFARLEVPVGESPALRVPDSAVVQRGQLEILFVVINGHAQLRLVKTGRHVGDEVEVLSGLNAGDAVVNRWRGAVDRRPTGGGAVKSEVQSPQSEGNPFGIAGRIARAFIDSKLTPLVVIASLLLGVFAVMMLPREEEPQIKVPMIDVMVSMTGAGAKEVEERVTRPMEKLLWEIPGVEYIYSTSQPGESLVIVRFKVGEDVEKSLVKLNQKLQSNLRPHPARRFPTAHQALVH